MPDRRGGACLDGDDALRRRHPTLRWPCTSTESAASPDRCTSPYRNLGVDDSSQPRAPLRIVRRPPVDQRAAASDLIAHHRWTVAALIVGLGVLAGWVVPIVGTRTHWNEVFRFDASSAQATLAAIAGGMITLTGFVFTAVTLVIQTVQSQSPRLLRAIDRTDRTPILFGLFSATFSYSLVALSSVHGDSAPAITVDFAIFLVLVCVAAFFRLLMTLRTRLTSGGLVRTIGNQLRESFEQLYPMQGTEGDEGPVDPGQTDLTTVAVHHTGAPGVFQSFIEVRLVAWAARHAAVVSFRPVVGDFVPTGAVVADVIMSAPPSDLEGAAASLRIGPVRTLDHDPAYGFRLLADIAVRALSPAVNDPTTAVQTLDQLHDLLQRLILRPLGNGEIVDRDGSVRVRYRAPTWETFVGLALDEIRIYGSGSLQVVRRLRSVLIDLLALAPEERQPSLRRRLDSLDEAVASHFADPHDQQRAAEADRQGLGAPET